MIRYEVPTREEYDDFRGRVSDGFDLLWKKIDLLEKKIDKK